jgi:hypothetical protein
MEINGIHVLLLEDLRRQRLQDKNNLHAFEMFRQELMAIQATGDHLPDAVIPKALADFPQSSEGRFRIAQSIHRIKAAIKRQPDPLVQPAAQDVTDPADKSRPVCGQIASRPENRIRALVMGKREFMPGFCEPAGAVQRLADGGRDRILPNHPPLHLKKGSGWRQTLEANPIAPAAGGAMKSDLRTFPENPVGRAILSQKGADVLTEPAAGTKIRKIIHK